MHASIVEDVWTSVKPRDSTAIMIEAQMILSDFIAIGVVNPSDALTAQQGLNAEVLVEGPFENEAESRRKIRTALAKLDHKTVGRDIKIHDKPETTLPEITEWLFDELVTVLPETAALTIKFGNYLTCEIRKGWSGEGSKN